ncbi:MAG: tRNA uridine-5-carboxymethylaminomethyl(34) synthesis GTPase MnmE [Pseudomonadota bacterium]
MASSTTDTICAIATPPGRGGIGVVRISGPSAADIAQQLIGKQPSPRQAQYVSVRANDNTAIDQGLALYFPGPNSFTGEDVLELQLHGSPIVLEKVLAAAVTAGARRAEPGEFSQRAFLNDKIDLAQAEAIADLIAATSEQAARAAQRSLEGRFSKRVHALAEAITHLRVWVEAALDFPDEDIDFLADGKVLASSDELIGQTRRLLDQAEAGRLLTDGIRIAIVGKPNAGKSSLFNALVQRNSAIVTDIPGTTRDVLRETLHFAGIPASLADTAGLRETDDVVELEGVKRAQAELEAADLVLWVVDASQADAEQTELPAAKAPVIRVDNKIDRLSYTVRPEKNRVAISALTGQGLAQLDAAVTEMLGMSGERSSEFSARARHVEQIERTLAHLKAGREQLVSYNTGELLAEELRQAADALGEITGKLHSDELLGKIFSSFCIGK